MVDHDLISLGWDFDSWLSFLLHMADSVLPQITYIHKLTSTGNEAYQSSSSHLDHCLNTIQAYRKAFEILAILRETSHRLYCGILVG